MKHARKKWEVPTDLGLENCREETSWKSRCMWVRNIGVNLKELGCDDAEWIQPAHGMVPVNTTVRLKILHRGKFFYKLLKRFFLLNVRNNGRKDKESIVKTGLENAVAYLRNRPEFMWRYETKTLKLYSVFWPPKYRMGAHQSTETLGKKKKFRSAQFFEIFFFSRT